jgi:curved DNA-binding protein CbpA
VQGARNLYKQPGLSREASQDDIRKAHRKLVREYHPDANPEDPRAEERFKQIQQAYEVLSNPEKRREYDKDLHTSFRGNSGGARTRAGESAGGGTAHTVDLSDLLDRLSDLSSGRAGWRREGNIRLRGEDIANVGKLSGVDVSRISTLLGEDITRLSKHLGENIKMNAKVSFGDVQTDGFSATDEKNVSKKPPGSGNKPRIKRVKGPRALRRRKSS